MDVLSITYITDMQSSFSNTTPATEISKSQNFGLSAQAFENLLDQLGKGDERLFEKVFVSQFHRCTRYLIVKYSAAEHDAKDVVMNTLLDFRKLLLAHKVTFGNLEAYFTKMTVTNYLKKRASNPEIYVEHLPEETTDLFAPAFTEAEYTMFAKAWSNLCDKCKMVLERYYYDDLPHAQIASLMGKNLAAVKQDKHRCVEKLRKHFILSQNQL
jgi:RNA polymerase sigma factor (sigma-70 family)